MSTVITVDKDGCVPLWYFAHILNTDKVEYYKIKAEKNGTLIIKFYDKNKRIIKPYKDAK
jgi:hypothetical protein